MYEAVQVFFLLVVRQPADLENAVPRFAGFVNAGGLHKRLNPRFCPRDQPGFQGDGFGRQDGFLDTPLVVLHGLAVGGIFQCRAALDVARAVVVNFDCRVLRDSTRILDDEQVTAAQNNIFAVVDFCGVGACSSSFTHCLEPLFRGKIKICLVR